jgi:hypothetical protein
MADCNTNITDIDLGDARDLGKYSQVLGQMPGGPPGFGSDSEDGEDADFTRMNARGPVLCTKKKVGCGLLALILIACVLNSLTGGSTIASAPSITTPAPARLAYDAFATETPPPLPQVGINGEGVGAQRFFSANQHEQFLSTTSPAIISEMGWYSTSTPLVLPKNMPLDSGLKKTGSPDSSVWAESKRKASLEVQTLPLSHDALPYRKYFEIVAIDAGDAASSTSNKETRKNYSRDGLHSEKRHMPNDPKEKVPHFIEFLPELPDAPASPKTPWTFEEDILVRDLLIGKFNFYNHVHNSLRSPVLTSSADSLAEKSGAVLDNIPCEVSSLFCASRDGISAQRQNFERAALVPSLRKAELDSKTLSEPDDVLKQWMHGDSDVLGTKGPTGKVNYYPLGEAVIVRTYHGEWVSALTGEKKLAEQNDVNSVKRLLNDVIFHGPTLYDEDLQRSIESVLSTGVSSDSLAIKSEDINSHISTLAHAEPAPRIRSFMLLGYGTDPVSNEDFWLIRGTSKEFGVQGYLKVRRGGDYDLETNSQAFDEIWTVEVKGDVDGTVSGSGEDGSRPLPGIADLPKLLQDHNLMKDRLQVRLLGGSSWEMQRSMKKAAMWKKL